MNKESEDMWEDILAMLHAQRVQGELLKVLTAKIETLDKKVSLLEEKLKREVAHHNYGRNDIGT